MRPILHIHLHPQTSKSLHPRFYLGRADHPERIKQLAEALRSQPTNIQGIADLDAVGAKGLSVPMFSPSTPHSVIDWVDDSPTQSTRKW